MTESPSGAEVFFATQYSFLLGLAWLFIILGGGYMVFAFVRWRGDPRDRLLLAFARRLRESEARDSGD